MDPALAQVRHRRPPRPPEPLYGRLAGEMQQGSLFRSQMHDRAAYMYITGQFPSHSRGKTTQFLRAISRHYLRPASLDGRCGDRKIWDEVVTDLELARHPMVLAVRQKISEGYLIQPTLGVGERRNFWKIFMFRPISEGRVASRLTVQIDGAVKDGW